jgi:signal peptidase II
MLNKLSLGILIVWIGADQALKFWTMASIPLKSFYYLEPIPGFLSLGHDVNFGAAWSLFSGASPILIVVRGLVGLGLLIWLCSKPRPILATIAFSLIIAGAWGNAIDGFLRDGVVDMLQSHWLSAVYQPIFGTPFPIFNIADIGVVLGVLLLIGFLYLPRKKERIDSSLIKTPMA